MTYKQKLIQDFEKAVKKQTDKNYSIKDLKNCFFQLQVDQVSSNIEKMFQEGLHNVQNGGAKLQTSTMWTPYSTSKEGSYSANNLTDHAIAAVKANPYAS